MTFIVVTKDTDGQKPYRYTGIIGMLTTPYTIKLISRSNRVISLDRELIVNMMIEECEK